MNQYDLSLSKLIGKLPINVLPIPYRVNPNIFDYPFITNLLYYQWTRDHLKEYIPKRYYWILISRVIISIVIIILKYITYLFNHFNIENKLYL